MLERNPIYSITGNFKVWTWHLDGRTSEVKYPRSFIFAQDQAKRLFAILDEAQAMHDEAAVKKHVADLALKEELAERQKARVLKQMAEEEKLLEDKTHG